MTGGGRRSPPDGRSTGGGLEGGYPLRSRSARPFPLSVSPLPISRVGLDVDSVKPSSFAGSSLGVGVNSVPPTVSPMDVVAVVNEHQELAGGLASDLPSALPAGSGHLPSSVPCTSDVMLKSSGSLHGGGPAVVLDLTSGQDEAVVSSPDLIHHNLASDMQTDTLHVSSADAGTSPLVSREISGSLCTDELPPPTAPVFKFQESLLGNPGCPRAQASLFPPIGQRPMDSLEAVKGLQFSVAGSIPRFDAQKPSVVLASNSRVEDHMVTNKSEAVPNVKAWSKPQLCRLPAKELHAEGVVRGDRVQLDVEDVLATSKCFESALVGRLFGRRFNFETLNLELHRRWAAFGGFKLVMVSGDCFIYFFSSIEGCEAVLLGGPWVIAGQVIGIDRWSPDFSPNSKAGFVTHVWVRFPSLPMYCWGAKNIVRIAGLLGDPIYMDAATEKLDRSHYARVCIRMDLSLPLRAGLWIDGPHGSFHQAVEYEGLPRCCFKCGLVGHRSEWCTACLPSPQKVVAKPPVTAEVGVGPTVIMDEGVAVGNTAAVGCGTGLDSGQVDKGVSGGSVTVPPADHVPGAPDGLGPWMLVSYKRKPPRPAVDRRITHGSWEREGKGQWQLKKNFNAAGSGGSKAGKGELPINVGARGKDKMQYIPRSIGNKHVPPFTQPIGSLHCEGQTSKGGLHFTNSGSQHGSLHGPVHSTLLVPLDANIGTGMGSEESAGKRALKRKKDSTPDGGDASPMGLL